MSILTAGQPWVQPQVSPPIYFDLFPSSVILPNRTYTKTRILITAPPIARLYVISDGNKGPEATLAVGYDPELIFGDTREGFDLLITEPAPEPFIAQIRPEQGCGCGMTIKNMNPFSVMRHTTAPPLAGPLSAAAANPILAMRLDPATPATPGPAAHA